MFFGFFIGSVLIGGELDLVQRMEGLAWKLTAFDSAGTVLRSESSYAGTNVDIVTCIASGLGPDTARIRSFVVEYNSGFIPWGSDTSKLASAWLGSGTGLWPVGPGEHGRDARATEESITDQRHGWLGFNASGLAPGLFTWIRFLNENKMTLGYFKKFRRLNSSLKEEADELFWLSESKGSGQAGYVEEKGAWKCQIGGNHSLNVTVDYEYNTRNLFGLLRKRGHSQAVYHFEKNHDISDTN